MFVLDDQEVVQQEGFSLDQQAQPEKKKTEAVSGFQLDVEEQPSLEQQDKVKTDDTPGFELDQEVEPGFLTKAYRGTLGKVLDFFKTNEIDSQKLIPIEGYEKPKPTDSPQIATIQLVAGSPESLHEEILEEIAKLKDEGKLFSEEAVNRLPVDKAFSRKVLLTGMGDAKPFRRDVTFMQAIREGQQESAIGILTGSGIQDYETLLSRAESEIPFLKRQAKNFSKIIGDLPAFIGGGAAASLPAGGPETPPGAILAAVGAFSTQALIESSYNEALRLVHEHPELSGKTLEQLSTLVTDPEALKNIGLATLESGAIGALVAINPLMKALEKTPLAKLFTRPVIKSATALGSEVTTLTAAPAILHGKIPTVKDFLDNAVLLGGLKASGAAIGKVADYAKRKKMVSEDITKKLGEHVTEKDLADLDNARTIEEVDAILEDIQSRSVESKEKSKAELEAVEPKEEVKKAEPEPKRDEAKQVEEAPLEEPIKAEVDEKRKELEKELSKQVKVRDDFLEEAASSDKITEKVEAKRVRKLNNRIEATEKKLAALEPKDLKKRPGLEQPEQAHRQVEIGTEKDVPAKSEIIKVFKDAFQDTPIRVGKFAAGMKKGTRGFFSPGKNVIRLKKTGMLETAAHEFGHKLHMAMYGGEGDVKTQIANIGKALAPFMDELEPISRYDPHDLEGFAEFTRMYVTNPDAAKTLAPKFYDKFEKDLDAKAPAVKEALLQAREMFDRHIKADPVARTYAHIQSSFDRTLWQKTGDVIKRNFNLDKIKTDWLDDMFPIKRAVADTLGVSPVQVENWKSRLNPYIAARVLKGWAGKSEVMLFHETFDFKSLKANGKSLKEILKPIETVGDRQELSAYLVAKRSEALRKRKIASGLDQRTEAETVRRLKDKYDPIAEELNDYQNRVLEYYRDSGMLSTEAFNKMKAVNKFYVPFFRFFEEGEKRVGKKSGKETGKLQSQQIIKQIFGSQREIIDPLESIVSNTFAMVQQAEKNRFGQILSSLTQINPRGGKFMERLPPKMHKVFEISKLEILDAMIKEAKRHPKKVEAMGGDEGMVQAVVQMIPDSIEKWRPGAWSPGENIVTVYRDGKPTYYETTPPVADVFKNSGSRVEASIIRSLGILPAKVLRAGAILNPKFMMKNAVRDLIGGVVFTKHSAKPILDDVYKPMQGLFSSIKKDDLYVDWLKAGGGMSTMQSIDKNVVTIKKGLGKGMEKVRPIAMMRRIGEVTEEMNRLAEYSKAIEAMGTDRWQKEMAAFQSRDVSIDFAKVGLKAKALNQMIPFWNATIQGGDKLIRTLASKDPEVIQNFMTRVAAGVVTPTLLLQAANYGDPDIEEIDEVTKDTNWIFKNPISGNIIQIPVPFETGVLFHGMARRAFNWIIADDPKAFDGYFGSIVNAGAPGFIPAFAQAPLEVWANKDFWRNQRIIPPSQIGLISEEQYGVYTSETAKIIANAMSYMPGINKYESNLTSPAIIEHFVRTYGAGLGQIALKASDAALKAVGVEPAVVKPEERLLRQLGLDAFVREFPTARMKSVEQFYDRWEQWSKLERSIKSKIEKGDVKGAKRLQADLKSITSLDMKAMTKALQRNQALINNVYHNPKMSAKEKREIINKLYLQQTAMARGFMKNIDRKN